MKSTSLLSISSIVGFTAALPQVSQISDGQPQAPTAVFQISDGQIQATATVGAGSGASPAAGAPTVVIKNGTYQGMHLDTYNEDIFLGIPYAQPPVGPLRFTIPQPINTTFDGVREATEYYPACVGYGGDDIGYAESEDCLAINVIRPSGYEGQALPVGFWIHGGGLIMGSGGDHRYNLSFIVQNSAEIGMPIIGVSINYRLAGWGFLASLQVLASGQTNLGIRDQRLAMAWVQENIAAFGGDPTKVTIWGESSGASSVGYHLTAYGGRDDKLFRAGIMESGGPFNTFQSDTYYQPRYDAIVNATGCNDQIDTLNCLRYLPFDQLNAVLNTTMFNGTGGSFDPILDGDLLQSSGSLQLAAGKFVHVPIIDGANTDEGTSFGPKGIQNASQFQNYLESPLQATGVALPEFFATEILQAYPDDPALGIPSASEIGDIRLNATYGTFLPLPSLPPANHPPGYEYRRTSAYAGDAVFIANRRLTCSTFAAANLPSYCYRFNTIPNGINWETGVTHFQEVAFVFNNVDGLGYNDPPASPDPFLGKPASYFALSKLMSCSWASFISELDPNAFRSGAVGQEIVANASGAAMWPNYIDGPMDIVWDANVTTHVEADTFRAPGIDLINSASLLYQR